MYLLRQRHTSPRHKILHRLAPCFHLPSFSSSYLPHNHRHHSPYRRSLQIRSFYSNPPNQTDPNLDLERLRQHKIKHAFRGGKNLSERYKRLEKSLRGKTAFTTGIGEVLESGHAGAHEGTKSTLEVGLGAVMVAKPKSRDTAIMFRGLEIPKEPITPESDECCMSGCAVCIYDLYEEAIERYRESIEEAKVKLRTMGVNESEWPVVLIGKSVGHGGEGKEGEDRNAKKVVMDAFEALERELQAKKTKSEVGKGWAQGNPGNGAQVGGRPGGASFNSASVMRDVSEAVSWVIFGNRCVSTLFIWRPSDIFYLEYQIISSLIASYPAFLSLSKS